MNKMQQLKRRFFAMRNGVIADALRRSGEPYRIFFGLNLPQIKEIATDFAPDAELAAALRADPGCRESQMIAPMLLTPEDVTVTEAVEWLAKLKATEASDILCHALLRHHPQASEIVDAALAGESDMAHYGAVRLMWNIFRTDMARYKDLAATEATRGNTAAAIIARNLVEEIEFLQEDFGN